MLDIQENVRHEITRLIPSSLLSNIACFVFYDNHPRDEKNIDISICTNNGELKEFFQRDLINSLKLNCASVPVVISILRNNNCEHFYLVATKDELFIISRKENLQIHKKLSNIARYDVIDTTCSGQTFLQVIRKDDAVPILYDNNFESLEDHGIMASPLNNDDTLPIVTELKRKLVEAEYTAKCNEKTYKYLINLHQKIYLMSHQSLHPNLSNTTSKENSYNISGALVLKTQTPWIKVCNNKIIIVLNLLNKSKESIENVHMLLNSKAVLSLVYKTKLVTNISTSPFWRENDTLNIKPNQEAAVVAIMHMDELKHNVTSRIEVSGLVSYKMEEKEYLLPINDVAISSLQSMGDEFDVLSSKEASDQNTILALIAATEKTELCIRNFKTVNDPEVSLIDLFCTHLHMEKVGIAPNIIVYRKSPYHALYGIMMVFHDSIVGDEQVTVYTRSPSQILFLFHYIYDAIPAKIVATTPTYRLTAKTDELPDFDEEIPSSPSNLNYLNYASSILNRSTKILEHLDNSMIKMSESKNPLVQSKVGSHIDLFAGGVDNFKDFRESVLKEAREGIDALTKLDQMGGASDKETSVMVID